MNGFRSLSRPGPRVGGLPRTAGGAWPEAALLSTDMLHNVLVNLTDWRAYLDASACQHRLVGGLDRLATAARFLRRLSLVVPIFIIPYLLEGTVREARYYLPILGS